MAIPQFAFFLAVLLAGEMAKSMRYQLVDRVGVAGCSDTKPP